MRLFDVPVVLRGWFIWMKSDSSPEQVQLELFLGSEKRDQMIEAVDFVATEYQFVIFE